MAKTDSFFIRARIPTDGTNYSQIAVDCGAYVDALGKSVLRVHNIAVQYGDPVESLGAGSPNAYGITSFQLTTQSQASMVSLDDKSVIASGSLMLAQGGTSDYQICSDRLDISPQMWKNGYLVGVEQIYLAVDQSNTYIDAVSIVLECTVETLSQSAAMALALSQQ